MTTNENKSKSASRYLGFTESKSMYFVSDLLPPGFCALGFLITIVIVMLISLAVA